MTLDGRPVAMTAAATMDWVPYSAFCKRPTIRSRRGSAFAVGASAVVSVSCPKTGGVQTLKARQIKGEKRLFRIMAGQYHTINKGATCLGKMAFRSKIGLFGT